MRTHNMAWSTRWVLVRRTHNVAQFAGQVLGRRPTKWLGAPRKIHKKIHTTTSSEANMTCIRYSNGREAAIMGDYAVLQPTVLTKHLH